MLIKTQRKLPNVCAKILSWYTANEHLILAYIRQKMRNAEETVAGFYHYIKNTEVQDKRNNEADIHKLNYVILFDPKPDVQDWVNSMVGFAAKSVHADVLSEMSDIQNTQFEDIVDTLRAHYNSIVPENKMLTLQMFEAVRKRQQFSTQNG